MKISYITMLWPAASETFAARDVLTLSRMGHDVEVMAMRPDGRDRDSVGALADSLGVRAISCLRMGCMEQIKGVAACFRHFPKVMRLFLMLLRHERNSHSLLKSILLMPAALRIFDRLYKKEPDVVHLFWGHYPAMVGMLVVRYLPWVKMTQFLGPYDLQYNYVLSGMVAEKANAVFTHVECNRQPLRNLGISDNKIVVVHRGIDVLSMQAAAPDNPASLIFVGRLICAKGIFEMLDVMADLLKLCPAAHLTVIGDGEDRVVFENMIAEKSLEEAVTLTGWQTPDQIRAHLSGASMMLFLSHSECLPNAVKEAMVCGIVPISSDTTGIDEMIVDGVNGTVVKDIADHAGIAQKIADIVQDKARYAAMSQQARQMILDRFDVERAMERYVAIWSSKP